MDDPNITLMTKIAKGDHIAFRTLATQLSGRMFGLAYRLMGGDAASAEDAVQDALIKIWTAAPNWRPTGKVESYVLTIVHRCCMDVYRKRRVTMDVPDTMADAAPSVEETMMDTDTRRAVMTQIDRLPERQRAAVLMSYFEGYSNRQIAGTLAVSEQAVESLLVRARRTLGQTLQDTDIAPFAMKE